jgi:hypothetical protein
VDADGVNGFTCDCAGTGFIGATCGVEVNECLENPCENGGTCANLAPGFECDCTNTGFEGATCAENIDECANPATNPCQNEGTCVDGVSSVTCDCGGTGYYGESCEDLIDTEEEFVASLVGNLEQNFEKVWGDEFDAGTALDSAVWTRETGGGSAYGEAFAGWADAQQQYYTDAPKNVEVQDGLLSITAQQDVNNFDACVQQVQNRQLQNRIVAGADVEYARKHQFFVKIIRWPGPGWICGATLVDHKWVVTAAHCVEGRNTYNTRVRIGMHSFSGLAADLAAGCVIEREIVDIIIHEGWTGACCDNDVAILELTDEGMPDAMRYMPIPTFDDGTYGQPGQLLTHLGFGDTSA